MYNNFYLLLIVCFIQIQIGHFKVVGEKTNIANSDGDSGRAALVDSVRRRCPLCDSSVYSYCSDKLFHDSCCCNNPDNPYYPLPPQCEFADCSFLHANSCQEHKLITACCCINHMNIFHKK